MPRTHHGASTYRLGCGCLAGLTGVPPAGGCQLPILCATCWQSTVIAFRYPPERTACAVTACADKPGGGVTRARCCLPPGHDGNKHFDAFAQLWYELPSRLAAGRKGRT